MEFQGELEGFCNRLVGDVIMAVVGNQCRTGFEIGYGILTSALFHRCNKQVSRLSHRRQLDFVANAEQARVRVETQSCLVTTKS